MNHIAYEQGHLAIDGVAIADLAARFGTPLYVYSRNRIEQRFAELTSLFGIAPAQLCYGAKANSNLAVLQVLAALGAGFDVVSGGELKRVVAAGGNAHSVVFSGVGKTHDELRLALELGIRCINVDSEAELAALSAVAGDMHKVAPVSLRINPDVDAKTHPYITTGLKHNKFGIEVAAARSLYDKIQADSALRAVGVDCHIGSQITAAQPLLDAAACLLDMADALAAKGIEIGHIDLGGGFGVRYRDDEDALDLAALAAGLSALLGQRSLQLVLEPGRYIVADAGILLAQVLYTKQSQAEHFTIVDAAMNDLLRPSLYEGWHDVMAESEARHNTEQATHLVGPVCETGDFLALHRRLALRTGDLVAFKNAGAYGFVMSSNYNARPRAAEVMISQGRPVLIRARETSADLMALEKLLPDLLA